MKVGQKMIALVALWFLSGSAGAEEAHYSTVAPVIDGTPDAIWEKADWRAMDQLMAGTQPDALDFSGRYKLLWDENHLYLLAEIRDDVLYDSHPDPRDFYWDDDCLEIFIDEDASGGDHLHNHNAFAYHIALDGHVADMGAERADGTSEILLLDDHAVSRWQADTVQPSTYIWEVAIKLHDDNFDPARAENVPVTLMAGKKIGFMVAYCDNDGSKTREHFMGSHTIEPVDGDRNLGYKTASVFGSVTLVR
jgi:hypothetical protein